MEYKFASRMERMKASEIRELLKLTARPEIISFAGGLPAPELFPVKEIAQVSHDLVLKEGQKLLQYATTEGRPTLREKIAKRMTEKYKTGLCRQAVPGSRRRGAVRKPVLSGRAECV